jgi:2-succinyl-6-hydroxy-2,4-cyclohexadiene-1-carboxylate synthase
MTDALKMHYEIAGDRNNPAVILLHGFMGSSADWMEDVIPSLSKDYYCIAVDLPGHGKTDTERRDNYTMDRCATAIASLMDTLSISQSNLIGYSMGGRLALYTAVNLSGRIGKAVIESASPGLAKESDRRARVEQDRKLADRILHTPMQQFLQEWYQQPLFETMDKESEPYRMMLIRRAANDPKRLALSLEMMGTGAQPSLWDKLDKIRSPLLLIVGEHDTKYRAIASDIANHCPAATTATVKDAGHAAHLDNPDEYIKLASQFLKS